MPVDNQQISGMLNDQQTGGDPFPAAKLIAQQRSTPPSFSDVVGKTPFDNTAPGPVENSLPQPAASSILFQNSSKQQQVNFQDSKVPGMMQKLGMNNNGIAFNQLGRIQLLGRLQKQFGDNYKDHPQALDILSAFDEHMKTQEPQDMKSSIAGGERTLSAIFNPGG